MTIRLGELLPLAPFPLFAVHPNRWNGDRFVGDISRAQERIEAVSIVYTDGVPPTMSGYAVSSIDGRLTAASGSWDPLDAHLANFAVRFDSGLLMKRFRSGRTFDPFRLTDFRRTDLVVQLAGETLGATWLQHKDRPLALLRVAVKRGNAITDLGIVTWGEDPRQIAPSVEQVDLRFAQEFDAITDPDYPPLDWTPPQP